MNKIEFGELRIGKTARKHLEEVCNSNWASSGPKVKQFESEWGKLFGYDHNFAVSSGTDACLNMCLAVRAYLEDEDKWLGEGVHTILVPALSFIATSNAVRAAGFKPKWVDIRKDTLNINESKIENSINSLTVAIMPVHTMGRPCEMDKILEIARRYNLFVLEDCCEAHGAKFKGTYIGNWGDMAAFSFYVVHLVCAGEGGMVSTNNSRLASYVTATRSHGRAGGNLYFDHPYFGLNSKMNDLEASLGLEGIENFSNTFNVRWTNMKYIMNGIRQSEKYAWFSEEDEGNTNCPHGISFTIKDPKYNIKELCNHLDKDKIHWKRNFGCIPTQHRTFNEYQYKLGSFPEAEYVGDHGIHIGCHQYLSANDLDRIITSINNYFNNL